MRNERKERALECLRAGKAIIVRDDDDRECEGDFVAAAQAMSADMVNFMITKGRGLLCCAVDAETARRLELAPARRGAALHDTAFTESVDLREGATTGISCADRSACIMRLADREAAPGEFARPGHVFPLVARPGGVLERRGHTEAAVDLCRMAGLAPAGAICEIIGPDGTMTRGADLEALALELDMPLLTVEEIASWRRAEEPALTAGPTATIPTPNGDFKLTSFARPDGTPGPLLFSIGLEPPSGKAREFPLPLSILDGLLVRVHSECATGDLFGSLRCDCGQQLKEALRRIGEEGRGALVYLRQEGRGIGLEAKLRAYGLQDGGLDTADANLALGFPADARDYWEAAQVLKLARVASVRLLTNNPEKAACLERDGVRVERRLPLEAPVTRHNEGYLKAKRDRFGHTLTIERKE